MRRLLAPVPAVLVGLGALPAAWAGPFTIDLKAQAGKASQTAHAETLTRKLGTKPKPRGVLEVKAGERVTVRWTLGQGNPKDTAKDILVHFFVVKEAKAGQQAVPKLDQGVVVESALTMDFQPSDKTEGELTFVIAKPGPYLLRLETIGAAMAINGRESFAALDLVALPRH